MGLIFDYILLDFCLLPAIFIAAVSIHYVYSFSYWKRRNVPFITPKFPFGSVTLIAQEKQNFGETFADIYKSARMMSEKYLGVYIFTKPLLLVADLDLVKSILVEDFKHFQSRGIYYNEESDPLSGHLVNLHGVKWKKIRTKLTPTFTSDKMKMMFKTLVQCSVEIERVIDEATKTDIPIDIRDILDRFTIDNIGSCVFGLKCNNFRKPNSEFRKYGQMFFNSTMANAVKILVAIRFPKLLRILKIPIIQPDVSNFFLNVFKETVEYREKSDVIRKDFIDLFIKLKNNENLDEIIDGYEKSMNDSEKLTFNELVAQAFVFFAAGYETCSTTMNYCLFELAIEPDIQRKLRCEILEVLQKNNGLLTYDSVMEMNYLDKVINETLRKYPPFPILKRECNETYRVSNSDVVLEKGVQVWISTLGIHRDPDLYPNPDKFDPERFDEQAKAARHQCSYIPFGDGPRNCIGLRFGYLQVKVGIIALLKKHKYTMDSKTKLPFKFDTRRILLLPKEKIWLHAERICD